MISWCSHCPPKAACQFLTTDYAKLWITGCPEPWTIGLRVHWFSYDAVRVQEDDRYTVNDVYGTQHAGQLVCQLTRLHHTRQSRGFCKVVCAKGSSMMLQSSLYHEIPCDTDLNAESAMSAQHDRAQLLSQKAACLVIHTSCWQNL